MVAVSFSILRDLAKKELSDVLEKCAGTKLLVWDEGLIGPMDLIAKYKFFQERDVVQMLPLKSGRVTLSSSEVDNVIFITRPEVINMDKVADNVFGEDSTATKAGGLRSERRPGKTEFNLLFVPSSSYLCEMRLKDRGVYGSFNLIEDLPISWFPLDADVATMDRKHVFREYHLNRDPTCLHQAAVAMMSLQAVFGVIPRIYGKGSAAKNLCDFMLRLRRENLLDEGQEGGGKGRPPPQFDTLVIIDRQVDLVSPLITQLTYEGLIDETFRIRNGSVRLPAEKFGNGAENSGDANGGVKQIALNSDEEMYAELRDKNFNAVGATLGRKARAISAQFDERHGAKTVREFKMFVDKLPQMQVMKQSLQTHTTIAEMIKEVVDSAQFMEFLQMEQELINHQNVYRQIDFWDEAGCLDADIVKVLRIICLQSVITYGLKPKVFEAYRKALLQQYGPTHLLSLLNLDKVGLLTTHGVNGGGGGGANGSSSSGATASNYAVLRKRLNLTQDDVNEQNPSDISYVHSVYAPLSIRLVQNCTSPGWRSVRDVLDLLPGPSFEEVQKTASGGGDQQLLLPVPPAANLNNSSAATSAGPNRTLVFFVGGCTFAEISALRFLSQQEEWPAEYFVCTTSIINGNNFIGSLMSKVEDSLGFPF